jgi:hypothetical protein
MILFGGPRTSIAVASERAMTRSKKTEDRTIVIRCVSAMLTTLIIRNECAMMEEKMITEEVSKLREHGVASYVSSSGVYPETNPGRASNIMPGSEHKFGAKPSSTNYDSTKRG